MGVHLYHPDTLEHGLDDGCPECSRKAHDPIALLDSQHIADLWNRMVAVEQPSRRHCLPAPYDSVAGGYRSDAEAAAARHLYRVALFLERHTSIEPWYALGDLGLFTKGD